MRSKKALAKIMREVAADNGLTFEDVYFAYMSYWRHVRHVMESVDFTQIKTEEDLKNTKHSVRIPFIGSFYTNIGMINHINENKKKKNEKIEHKEDDAS